MLTLTTEPDYPLLGSWIGQRGLGEKEVETGDEQGWESQDCWSLSTRLWQAICSLHSFNQRERAVSQAPSLRKFWFFCFLAQGKLINMTAIDADLSEQQELWEPSTGSSPTSALTSISPFLLPSCHTPHSSTSTGLGTQQGCRMPSMGDTLDWLEEDWHINPGLTFGGQSLTTYFYQLVVGKFLGLPAMCQVLLEVWWGQG